MSINGLADWHDYYDRLNNLARKPNIEHTILSYISKYSPVWDNYISVVRQEIIERAGKLNEDKAGQQICCPAVKRVQHIFR